MSGIQSITLYINGQAYQVAQGCTVAAAIAQSSPIGITRRSVGGQLRAPFCGMGVCHECRVLMDDKLGLACQTLCRDNMWVETSTGSGS